MLRLTPKGAVWSEAYGRELPSAQIASDFCGFYGAVLHQRGSRADPRYGLHRKVDLAGNPRRHCRGQDHDHRADRGTEQNGRGVKPEEIGNHAEVRDTSELLAVDPTMVRMNKLEKGTPQNGVQGDPRHASAEIGRVLNERNIVRTVDLIKTAVAAR